MDRLTMKSFSPELQKEMQAIPKKIKLDPVLRWNMTDEQFFAKGVCHVLAFAFKKAHPDYEIYLIKPLKEHGWHVFCSNKKVCFDYQGYTQYKDYIENYIVAGRALFEDWNCEVIRIEDDFNTFCEKYNHRKLEDFLHNPIERAKKFIEEKKL